MQAVKKLGRKRGRGVMDNMDVVKMGARSTKKKERRAQLEASGWKQSREDPGETKRELQEKMKTILLDFQERRKAQRVRQRALRPHDNTSKGELKTFTADTKTEDPQGPIEAPMATHLGHGGNDKTNVPSKNMRNTL